MKAVQTEQDDAMHKANIYFRALLLVVTLTTGAWGQVTSVNQDPAQRPGPRVPQFDVVSVKPSKSVTGYFRSGSTPDGISVVNTSLLMLIRQAYGLFNSGDDRILGVPSWVKADRFDIEAKVNGADVDDLHKLNRDQRGLMLQALLADRFQFKAHRESRELPAYYLVIAKGGPKLKEATSGETDANGANAGMMRMTRGQLTGHTVAISNMLSALTQITGRTVLDKTGLSGRYDVNLTWTPDEPAATAGSDGAGQTASTTSESGPSIFTAIQDQLGLKLESGKGPVDCLVVDHVAPPSEN